MSEIPVLEDLEAALGGLDGTLGFEAHDVRVPVHDAEDLVEHVAVQLVALHGQP